MESISPNIFVKDINQTIKFYRDIGFEISMSVPEEGDPAWVMMNNGKVSFMFQTFASLGDELPMISRKDGGSLLLYIQVKDITKFYDQISAKIKVFKELEKTFYGAMEFSVIDNNGFILTFAENEH